MGTYRMSNNERIEKSEIDRKIREAKRKVLADQIEEFGYNFCTICNRNDCIPVDCAHIISVDKCQKSGRVELAWNPKYIIPAGRKCHKRIDNVELKFKGYV